MSDSVAGTGRAEAGKELTTSPAFRAWSASWLILVAAVANLNLAVANVALPSIAREFRLQPDVLNLIAVGYSLGLAASVLYSEPSGIAAGAS